MQNAPRLAATAVIAALALSACAATGQQTPLPDASNVALGQRAYADGPVIQPVAVIEDSRCPMNARCIWAGRVKLKMLWLRPTGEKQPFEVTLGAATPLADGSITLESVRPEKRTDVTIRPEDYRFSFRFAGGL
ncbi:hypothetical protein [Sphingopyxis macrogoltabida]|uniref:Lipoprotein n=1 Tax=Sphingopyxis macrogoltabida TaxID=33050 RepID=A0A0N9UUM0_SPHMC|nr:hypothetical protein [Sphingopyxis macrogoltabida]ALH80566.1 hypothetical protein AN936_09345 [Sphingopyxis macrogoltabida]